MRDRFYRFCIKSAIIMFWLAVFFIALQVVRYSKLFQSRQVLYVATWPLLIDANYIKNFEKETGIQVKLSYFEHSQELYGKLKATGGRGYDVIFPSDYTVDLLIQDDLLKPLDRSKLTFWDNLEPRLLGNYYDPDNRYSIPFFWSVFGVLFNSKIYGPKPDQTWGILFDENQRRIVMPDNPREIMFITTHYLYGAAEHLQEQAVQKEVMDLLIQQKKRVSQYTDERIDELLSSENSFVALGLATDAFRAKKTNPNIGFFVPKEGTFIVIDSVALSQDCEHEDAAYAFINYLYQEDVMQHHMKKYDMCSPLQSEEQRVLCPEGDMFDRLHFFTDVISEKDLNTMWIDLLAR